jgi:hypothetical protein
MSTIHGILSAEQFAAGTTAKGTETMYGDPEVICRLGNGTILTGEVDEQPLGSSVGFLYINKGVAALITDGPFSEAHTQLNALTAEDLAREQKRYSTLWAPETYIYGYTRGTPGFVVIPVDDLKVGWLALVDGKTGKVTVVGYTRSGKKVEREGERMKP